MGETIEEIFDDIGGFGKAQWICTVLISYMFLVAAWSMMQMAFAVKIPDWYCVEETSVNDTQQYGSQQREQLQQLYTNRSDLFQKCSLNQSSCASYDFVTPMRTVVNEWSLVCDHKWIPSTMISIQMAGVLLGAVLAGQLSERWGRKRCLTLAAMWHIVANVVAACSTSWGMFAACRFLIGVGIGGIYTNTFPYSMEFLPLKQRASVALFPFWTFGVAIFVGFAYVLPNWRYLHLGCAAFCLPGFAIWFIVPESIRWLTVEGRLDEAMEAIGKLAQWNGKPVPSDARPTLEMIYYKRKQERKASGSYSYLDLFRDAYLLKCSVVIAFMWASMSLISYGISFGAAGLAGNLYLNILLTNCVEIPGLLPVLWMMNRIGRRWTTVIMFIIITITTISSLVVNLKGSSANERVVFWFALVTKLCVDTGWNVIQAWGTELYPTVTRTLGYGVATTSARIGGMLAPFLINLKTRLVLTYVTITCLSITGIFLSFLLPETRLAALKDNLSSTASSSLSGNGAELESGIPLAGKPEQNGIQTNSDQNDHDSSSGKESGHGDSNVTAVLINGAGHEKSKEYVT
ncbi:hypothetical protein EGW08_007360 [Elysia chlorotica]|uniref:Major facilitator superfamily (MFS) profile domain-containing protein n=1 Tax=Elysia chlorotica TaxID=188477 RepID=A0A3S1A7Z3_ELYCH|nr:hypothetical protein EGW08_007360 [Elysia chlorotica]